MNLPKKEKFYTDKEAITKIYGFCAYQERNQQEVRDKLYSYGLKKSSVEDILAKLIEENFLNEERFAKQYAGGKFRIKQWGRNKILEALRQKDISEYCMKQAMKEIPEEDYRQTLQTIIEKRNEMTNERDSFKQKYKIAQYCISRGFESELVWDMLNKK